METLSKANQLGIIILALQLLRGVKFPLPRLVRAVARLLGVSSKAGYQAAPRICRRLKSPEEETGGEDLSREVFRLRIRNQVLTYERDHPGMRFSERGHHLPPDARSLCVRIQRDFKGKLSQSEIASLLEVPLSSLRRWESEADEESKFSPKPDGRGSHRRASAEDAQRVCEEFQKLMKSMTLEEFSEHFKAKYPERALDRRTITRILQAEGLLELATKSSARPYHDNFEVYFPGAQVSLDAKECTVVFPARSPEKITVVKEVAIDIATTTILGRALETQENSEGVQRVVVEAREECVSILAILSDNGPANRAQTTKTLIQRESAVGQIFSFPYRPETNGHIEGLFGQFSRIVGTIEIDDSSREAIARSVVEVVFRIYVHFHNHSPRERLGGLSPMAYLRRYCQPPAHEVEEARKGLQRKKERCEARRHPPERLSDPRFRSLVEEILKRNGIEKPLEQALKALLPYDNRAIENASGAFWSYSQRDSFEESKRSFAYFMGIVRNKQKEIDEARLRDRVEAEKARRQREQFHQQSREIQREKAQEEEDLERNPEKIILKYSQLLLSGGLSLMRRTWLQGLRSGLRALQHFGRRGERLIQGLVLTIRSWGKYSEKLKEAMVDLLYAEYRCIEGRKEENQGFG